MSLPGDLTTCTVVGTYVDSAGVALPGRITFTPTALLADVTGSVVIPPVTRAYTLSAQGAFQTDPLVATDCETISPQGWQYEVQLSIAGLQPQSWNILLPASGSPADISGITPVVPQAAVTSYLPQSGGTVSGTLTVAGTLQIPSGASDGDVLTSDPSGNASWGPITAAEIPAAASGAIGGVELNTDLGGTATAPHVVATHLASALPLNQGGTGSAIQNFAAVFNVKGYGAAGDGSTPDDTAIQAAISAAVTAGGGTVFFPKGAYKLATGLTMFSSVTLKGAGALVSTLRPVSGVAAITATGSSGSQITQTVYEDFGIVGPGQGTGSAPGMSLTWCTTGTRLSRLYIELCGTDGINATNCYTVSVRDCFLASNGGSGLNAQTSINSWAMSGNTALLNTQWGYYIMGGAAGVLTACDAESNGYGGTALLGTFSYTIEGGEHENNGSSGSGQKCGIYLGTGTGAYGVANNTTVRGNWLQGTSVALYGIVVDGATGTVIEGNGFQNNTTNHINVTASATATVIRSGNYLSVPSSGNVADAGTGTQRLDYDSTNAVMRSSGLSFGTTTGSPDVTFTRAGAGRMLLSGSSSTGQILKVNNSSASTTLPNLYLSGSGATDLVVGTVYSGLSFLPWEVTAAGIIKWGTGSALVDTTLSRSAAGVLSVGNAIGVTGLTGATAASRHAGATASGAPASGTFAAGDFVIDQSGALWICTAQGSPGTWVSPGGLANPMTTLGDLIYENATPAAARLAGNTTATKNFLTQTGTGSVSAAPAWGTIAAGDLPAGGTGAAGALQLDGTAADIQPPGTQAAGTGSLAAISTHVHPLPNGIDAADYGFKAWNGDPLMWLAVTAGLATGTAYVAKVMVRSPISVSKIAVVISNAPSMSSGSGAYLALYDHTGTQVGATADQSTVWNAAALYEPSLTGGPFNLTAQAYYVVMTIGAAAAPTITTAPMTPVINLNASGSGLMESLGIASTAPRWGTAGTSLTALPGSITPTSLGNTAAKTFLFWAALL